MGLVGVMVGVLAAVGVGTAVMSAKQSAAARRVEVWAKLAQRRGGRTLNLTRTFLSTLPSDAVEVRVGHVVVRLDLFIPTWGDASDVHTRARARFALGSGPHFRVTPAGLLADVGRSMGMQDVPLGDEVFDRAFVVKGEDYAGVRAAFPADVQVRLTKALPLATLTSDGSEVTLITRGARVLGLDDMLDVVGAVASVGADALEPLAEVLETTLTPAAGTWQDPTPPELKLGTPQGDATASVEWAKGGPRVELTLPLTRDLPDFRVVVPAGLGELSGDDARATPGAAVTATMASAAQALEGLPPGLLTEYGARLLVQLPGVLLRCGDGRLALRWQGGPDGPAFTAGVKLLTELAGGVHRTGAFR